MTVFGPRLTRETLTRPRRAAGVLGLVLMAAERHLGELLDPRDVATDFGPGGTDPNDQPPRPTSFGMPPYTP